MLHFILVILFEEENYRYCFSSLGLGVRLKRAEKLFFVLGLNNLLSEILFIRLMAIILVLLSSEHIVR